MRGFKALVGVTALALFGAVGTAQAITITFDSVVTGYAPESAPSPWLSATVTDTTGGVNIVFLTNVEDPEFVTDVYFNLVGGTDGSCGKGKEPAGTGPYQLCFQFDPNIKWNLNGGGSYSNATAPIFFGGVTETMFGSENASGWTAVAHIQGIEPDCSGWIGAGSGRNNPTGGSCGTSVPEPGTLGLLGLGLAGLGFGFRRRKV